MCKSSRHNAVACCHWRGETTTVFMWFITRVTRCVVKSQLSYPNWCIIIILLRIGRSVWKPLQTTHESQSVYNKNYVRRDVYVYHRFRLFIYTRDEKSRYVYSNFIGQIDKRWFICDVLSDDFVGQSRQPWDFHHNNNDLLNHKRYGFSYIRL